MKSFLPRLETARRLVRSTGPYLLLEILLPGGTLFALALFLYRRNGRRLAPSVPRLMNRVMHSGDRAPARRAGAFDIIAWARSLDAGCTPAPDGLEAIAFAPLTGCPAVPRCSRTALATI
ncbi:MAG: hypothetical protein ABI920_08455 [Casimicrobiaceae bacterium]